MASSMADFPPSEIVLSSHSDRSPNIILGKNCPTKSIADLYKLWKSTPLRNVLPLYTSQRVFIPLLWSRPRFWYSSFLWKFKIKVKNPPLSKQSPPFLEKIFHSHPYCQIWGSQSPPPFVKGGRGWNYVT